MDETGDHGSPPQGAEQPPPPPKPIPEHDTPHADPSAKERECEHGDTVVIPKHEPQGAHDRALVRWTGVVAVFTIVLAFVGGIQTWAFIQSERAAIYPQVERIMPFEADKTPVIIFSTLNTGKSQAFIVEIKIKPWIGELPDNPDYSGSESGGGIFLPPQGKRLLQMGPLVSLHWGQVDDIKRGALRLYVFGYLQFTDDFTFFGPKIIGFCAVNVAGSAPGSIFEDCQRPAYSYSQ